MFLGATIVHTGQVMLIAYLVSCLALARGRSRYIDSLASTKLSPSYIRQEAPLEVETRLCSLSIVPECGIHGRTTRSDDSDDKSKLLDVGWESNEWLIYEMRD